MSLDVCNVFLDLRNIFLLLKKRLLAGGEGSSMDKSEDSQLPGVDRISQLPDDIIDNILVKLPTADAARTTALSKKWKNGWISISQLKFDPSFDSKFCGVYQKNSILGIYAILMIHSGPITRLQLLIFFPIEISDTDRVFHLLSRKGVEELYVKVYFDVSGSNNYILPSHFYSCLPLRCLRLVRCTINPLCNFGGFRNLNHLVLDHLDLTKSVFENFIYKCPLLEELIIKSCNFKESSSVVIRINASNLKRFYFYGFGSCFRFIYVPLLKSLTCIDSRSFEWYGRGGSGYEGGVEKSSLEEFCNALPALEFLKVDCIFLQTLLVLNMPSTHGQLFKWLKSLEACNVGLWNMEEVTSLLGLIGSSPNLNLLYIKLDLPYNADGKENPFISLEPNHLNFSCKKLEVVTLSKIGGHDSEIDFVKLLLLKSPELKRMFIEVIERGTPSIRPKILTKVNQFQRASATAEVNFGGYE